jgi:uncharacterized protein
MSELAAKPVPVASDFSQPYWDGVAAGQLRAQRCKGCGVLRHYPRLLCNACYSDTVEWVDLTGHGKIHSWTVAHHPYHPAFTAEVPYTLVLVDLDEGIRAMGRWQGETPAIGQVVSGEFVSREGSADLVFAVAAG